MKIGILVIPAPFQLLYGTCWTAAAPPSSPSCLPTVFCKARNQAKGENIPRSAPKNTYNALAHLAYKKGIQRAVALKK